MTDWADEIADKLLDSWEGWSVYDECSPRPSELAAALRKAKADGMREAAELFDGAYPSTASILRLRAFQIEAITPSQQKGDNAG